MIKQGFIGFFDILGYQTIIDNNEISPASEIISDVIVNLPKRTSDLLLSLMKSEITKGTAAGAYEAIEARLISDSILLSLEVPKDTDDASAGLLAFSFLAYSSQLMRQAFDKGLPLRGAIDHGEFFLSENCFAGKPIINCYRIGNQMDVAGCVITEHCYEVVKTIDSNIGRPDRSKRLCFDCLIVNKDGSNERRHVLNWYDPYRNWGENKENLRSYIIDAFHAHGKDISPDIISKVNNTEIMLHKAIENIKMIKAKKPSKATS